MNDECPVCGHELTEDSLYYMAGLDDGGNGGELYMNASETLKALVYEYRRDRYLAKCISQEEANDDTD